MFFKVTKIFTPTISGWESPPLVDLKSKGKKISFRGYLRPNTWRAIPKGFRYNRFHPHNAVYHIP